MPVLEVRMRSVLRWLPAAVLAIWATVCLPLARAQDDDLDEPDAEEPAATSPATGTPLPNGAQLAGEFDRLILGGEGGPARDALYHRLENVQARQMQSLDRTCGLSDLQKQKLDLAARGDVQRMLRRLDRLRQEFTTARGTLSHAEVVGQLKTELATLRSQVTGGPFQDGSLFAKVRQRTLSPAQAEQYAARWQLARQARTPITVDNARELDSLLRLRQDVYRLNWADDGTRLDLLPFGKQVTVCDIDPSPVRQTLGSDRPAVDFDRHPAGRLLAIGENSRQVTLLDLITKQEQVLEIGQQQPSVRFSPDGQWLATGGYGQTALLWSVATGQPVHKLAMHNEGGLTPEFSPDGKILAVGNRNSTTRLFDVATGELRHELPLRMTHGLSFDREGQRLAVVYVNGSLALWDVETGKFIRRAPSKAPELYSVDWSPDGTLLATAGQGGIVTLWKAADLTVVNELPAPDWVIAVRFSPDGTRLAFAGGSNIGPAERFVEIWAIP